MRYFTVRNFDIVNTSMYKDSDLFKNEKNEKNEVGMLVNGKIEKMIFEKDLKGLGYVKKTDVSKMIDTALKKVTKDAT